MKTETAVTITDPDEMKLTISYPGRTEACWMSSRSKKLIGIFFAEYAFFDLQKSFVDNQLRPFLDDLKSCARRIMNVYPPTEGKPYQLIQKLARQYKKALIQIADERKAQAPKRDWI